MLTNMSTVTTRYGRLAGEEQDGLHVFKGVPFAAPPIGYWADKHGRKFWITPSASEPEL